MDKKLLYGTFSTITILIVIAALIFINLVVEKLNIEADLTSKELYTISDKSKEALEKVSEDVYIYVLSKTGEEDPVVKQLLNEYTANCPKIIVEYKDPYRYPEFTREFSENGEKIENDSVIVKRGQKHKIIAPEELYEMRPDYLTGTYTTTGLTAESEITNAINYVSMGKTPLIYYVVGHNELDVSESFKNEFGKRNYEVRNLNITEEKGVPEDCDILLMTTPAADYSKDEADYVLEYLAKDGNAMVFIDSKKDIPNFERILADYGVKAGNALIFEGDSDRYYQYPINIMPEIKSSDVTKQLKQSGYPMIISYAQGIDILELKKESISVEPIFTTSNSSYGKVSDNPKTFNFEEGDKKGPFNAAVLITDSYYTDKNHTTKLVVCGASSLIRDGGMTNASLLFAVDCANWLKGGESATVYIPAKSLETEAITVPDGTKSNITAFVCVIIPGVIFILGIIVWYKRRYS
ncbi:MAG: GldG family protein [Clostridiales bacterium]|nr:GldG family protein [Clostridiales bacterium]